MDKGFNDDELADIMNEIENLEQEFTEEVVAVAPTPAPTEEVEVKAEAEAKVEVPVASTPHVEVDQEMKDVLNELSEMPVEEVSGDTVQAHDDNVVSLHDTSANTPGSEYTAPAEFAPSGGHSQMSFSVEGDMRLDLSFNVSGKIVHLHIGENGFELELDSGMKFSIPLDENAHKKAA